MAIFLNRFTDKLRSPVTPATVVDDAESRRQTHFERLYNYLVNDEVAIKHYMTEAMRYVFKGQTINRMPLPYLNIFRRIIHRLSVVYIVPAERYLLTEKDGGMTAENEPNLRYQELLAQSNINAAAKQWNRFAKAFDTCYVSPVWRNGRVEYDVFAPHELTVEVADNDYLQPARVEYKRAVGDGYETVIWTDVEHRVLDEKGRMVPGQNPWNGQNRYGLIPFVPVRLRITENHWGEGDTQLADVNEKINVLLASTNYNAILQTHSQLVTVNFGLKEGEELRLGPDAVLNIEDATQDEVTPNAFYIKPDAAIDVALKQIDWMVKTAAMMRGLPASSVSIDETAQSGAAKAIDNLELAEMREDDIELMRPAEKVIYEVSRTVWNFNNPSRKIDESAVFGIDFQTPKAGMDPEVEWKVKAEKYRYGLWTPVMDMADPDEGISEEDALVMIQKNLAIKAQLNPAPTFTQEDEPDGDTGEAQV